MSVTIIKPTVGRVVWYYPSGGDIPHQAGKPLAAIVTCVYSDARVNLAVFDVDGNSHGKTSVPLIQEGAPKPDGNFCEWMPYQQAQARKDSAAAN